VRRQILQRLSAVCCHNSVYCFYCLLVSILYLVDGQITVQGLTDHILAVSRRSVEFWTAWTANGRRATIFCDPDGGFQLLDGGGPCPFSLCGSHRLSEALLTFSVKVYAYNAKTPHRRIWRRSEDFSPLEEHMFSSAASFYSWAIPSRCIVSSIARLTKLFTLSE